MNDSAQATPSRDGWRLKLRGLWALVHPGPSLFTALAYAFFVALASGGRPDLARLAVTFAGMVALQFAISALNDYRDRVADTASHKFKPIARGILKPWVALVVTALCVIAMVACYAPYGAVPLLLVSAFLALGVAYDMGLKSTPFGAVMMGLAYPLLPLLAWDLFATLKPALYWTFPIGLAAGAAIHIADALPDIAADRAAGAHTLASALGRSAHTGQVVSLAAANLLIVALAATGITPSRPVVLIVAVIVVGVLLLLDSVIYRLDALGERVRLQANFILTVITALTTAAAWIISAIL